MGIWGGIDEIPHAEESDQGAIGPERVVHTVTDRFHKEESAKKMEEGTT